jgi:hypothetical protein
VSDVALDHFTQNLTEGILRAHFQTSTTEATPAVTGKTYEYKIDLWPICAVNLKDHKVRADASAAISFASPQRRYRQERNHSLGLCIGH